MTPSAEVAIAQWIAEDISAMTLSRPFACWLIISAFAGFSSTLSAASHGQLNKGLKIHTQRPSSAQTSDTASASSSQKDVGDTQLS
jgi:hypothetical protein